MNDLDRQLHEHKIITDYQNFRAAGGLYWDELPLWERVLKSINKFHKDYPAAQAAVTTLIAITALIVALCK